MSSFSALSGLMKLVHEKFEDPYADEGAGNNEEESVDLGEAHAAQIEKYIGRSTCKRSRKRKKKPMHQEQKSKRTRKRRYDSLKLTDSKAVPPSTAEPSEAATIEISDSESSESTSFADRPKFVAFNTFLGVKKIYEPGEAQYYPKKMSITYAEGQPLEIAYRDIREYWLHSDSTPFFVAIRATGESGMEIKTRSGGEYDPDSRSSARRYIVLFLDGTERYKRYEKVEKLIKNRMELYLVEVQTAEGSNFSRFSLNQRLGDIKSKNHAEDGAFSYAPKGI
eukprot:34956-Amorphochlora_amoeboformis.AAC.1